MLLKDCSAHLSKQRVSNADYQVVSDELLALQVVKLRIEYREIWMVVALEDYREDNRCQSENQLANDQTCISPANLPAPSATCLVSRSPRV